MDRGRGEENSRQRPPATAEAAQNHQPPPHQKCPRCDSSNTKFCYYNNYSLSQPRYFCKACRRYWTQGGTLRNVPVGGGCRKTKRTKTSPPPEIPRTQPAGLTIPGQSRPFQPPPPAISQMGGGFSLAAMQSLCGGGTAAPSNFGAQFGANMALLHGLNFPPAAAHQFQPQNYFYPARPLNSWTQSLINRGGAASSSFWGSNATTADGSDQAGSSSFTPNQWPDNNPGCNPSD